MIQDFQSFTEGDDLNEAKKFGKAVSKMLAKAGNFAIDAIVEYLIENPDKIRELASTLKSKDKDLYKDLK